MHIFISYAKADTQKLAKDFHRQLNSMEGIRAWMDDNLEPMQAWAEQLEDEIKRADYILVLISPDVNREENATKPRSFVLREIAYAQSLNKPILTALVEATEIPITLQGDQYIDMQKNPQEARLKILDFFAARRDKTATSNAPNSSAESKKGFQWPFKFRLSEAIVVALIGAVATIIGAFISQNNGGGGATTPIPSPTSQSNQPVSNPSPQNTLAFLGTEGVFEVNLLYDGEAAFSIQTLSESDLRSVRLLAGATTIALMDYFPDVVSQSLASGDCLRFVQDSADAPPLPRACSQVFSVSLSNTEIFWFDKLQNQAVNVRLLLGDSSLGLCSATIGSCRFNQDGMQ